MSTAAVEHIVCPPTLSADAVRVLAPPAGWAPFTQFSLHLHGVGITYGPPAELADSKPVSVIERNRTSIVKWELDAGSPETKWIKCMYGGGSELTLSKQLADTTSACTASYTRQEGITSIDVLCSSAVDTTATPPSRNKK